MRKFGHPKRIRIASTALKSARIGWDRSKVSTTAGPIGGDKTSRLPPTGRSRIPRAWSEFDGNHPPLNGRYRIGRVPPVDCNHPPPDGGLSLASPGRYLTTDGRRHRGIPLSGDDHSRCRHRHRRDVDVDRAGDPARLEPELESVVPGRPDDETCIAEAGWGRECPSTAKWLGHGDVNSAIGHGVVYVGIVFVPEGSGAARGTQA